MRKIILTAALLLAFTSLKGYGARWEHSGVISASYNQTAVSGNWEGSETDSRSWMLKADWKTLRISSTGKWENTVNTEYGEVSLSGSETEVSADLIDLESLYTRKLNLYVNPYAAFTVVSQFNQFFNPALLGQSAGLGWDIISSDNQTLNLRAGGALRQKLQKSREPVHERGAESVVSYSLKIGEGARFISELKFFTIFKGSADMRWDSGLYFKLNQYLTARAGYLALFDQEEKNFPRDIQTRLSLGLGFSFNLL